MKALRACVHCCTYTAAFLVPLRSKILMTALTISLVVTQINGNYQHVREDPLCETNQATVLLPSTVNEFYNELNSQDFQRYADTPQDKWPPKLQTLFKYSGSTLVTGRPLGKVMIVTIGQSGSGKSSTINNLFADQIASTSADTSETPEVTEYGRELYVTSVSPAVKAVISLVDSPGSLDVDHKREAKNLASIKRFLEASPDLASRKLLGLPKNLEEVVREKVYPNIILLTVKATDNRMVGPDSNLQKSLKMLNETQMVDKDCLNLVIVVTHAMSISRKKYAEKSYKIIQNIRDAVYGVLRIQDIQVVFVENMPDDYEMVKLEGSDFYTLPDGEASHYNLIQVIIERFKANHDSLGRLLCGWYFSQTSLEKHTKPKILNSINHSNLSPADIREAEEALLRNRVQADYDTFPVLPFYFLGRGYCPRGESFKHINVFRETETKSAEIYGKIIAIPKYVDLLERSEVDCKCITSDKRETYENNRKFSYGLNVNIPLNIIVNAEGRWTNDNKATNNNGRTLVSFLYERSFVTFRINVVENLVHENLFKVIEELPDQYNPDDPGKFQAFFSKWGSHFVSEVLVGGSIKIDSLIQRLNFSDEFGSKISGSFKKYFASLEAGSADASRSFNFQDLHIHKFKFSGGNPPNVFALEDLTAQQIADWIQSIKQSPHCELEYSVKLYPYYDLVSQKSSLKNATVDYMAGSMPPEFGFRRKTVGEEIVNDVNQEKEWMSDRLVFLTVGIIVGGVVVAVVGTAETCAVLYKGASYLSKYFVPYLKWLA